MEYCLPPPSSSSSSSFNLHNRLITVSRPLLQSPPGNTHRRFTGRFPAFSGVKRCRSAAVVVVAASGSSYGGFGSGGGGYCEFSSLNTPIQPRTPAGRFLSSVLLNERKSFHTAVAEMLEKVAGELDEAYDRRIASADSSEACLHRRICELKGKECENAIEEIMYMLILYKFSEIKVHLIPRLSKCVYKGRLEVLPAKDWQLESIHSFEILEMIREHLTSVIGWRADFSVTDNWATTKIKRVDLCQIYTASILYGYFLKSATFRHQLELSLVNPVDDFYLNSGNYIPLPELYKFRQKNLVFGHTQNTVSTSPPFDGKKKQEKLTSYLMGFASDSLATCAEPKSKEALSLITKHTFALFGNVESDEIIISTSFATLKRFVLEAIAFGSFLWDTEEYVKTVYNLKENK